MQNNDSTNKVVRKPINTFHIDRKHLKAVLRIAAKDAGGFGFNGNYINLHQNGADGCAVCTTDSVDGFLGVIMPYRSDVKGYVKPEWAK